MEAGQALTIPRATVAETPLSLPSADLAPVGAPWTQATGPADHRHAAAVTQRERLVAGIGFRMLSRAVCGWIVDPKLDQLRAEVGPAAPARFPDGVPGIEGISPDRGILAHRGAPADWGDLSGRDPDAGGGTGAGPDAQADDARTGREAGVERDVPPFSDPQADGESRIGRNRWTGPTAPGGPDPQAKEGPLRPYVMVLGAIGGIRPGVLGRLPAASPLR